MTRLLLLLLILMGVAGCQMSSKKERDKAVEVQSVKPKQQVEEAPALPVARPQWKVEAERKAREARKRELIAAERRAAEVRKQAKAAKEREKKSGQLVLEKRKREAEKILKDVEAALENGNLKQVEEKLKAYRTVQGERALKQERYQQLRQKAAVMREVFADLDQAKMAEQYLQQLMQEAKSLQKSGKIEAARSKYGEVLALDPEHQAARRGMKALITPQKPAKKEQPRKKSAVKKSKTTSLLGKKAEGWIVQVATYSTEGKKEAFNLLAALKKAGFKATFIKKQELAGRQLYRVRVGAYGEKSEAEAVGKQIQLKMEAKGIHVAGRVTRQKP